MRSPPLRDGANPNAGRPAGKPGDNADGSFLGGAHSVRPQRRARGEPRHVVITWGVRLAGGKKGQRLDWRDGFLAGVRSPPLRGMAKRRREGLAWEGPGMALKALFSEGRTLCVRKDGPGANQGMSP